MPLAAASSFTVSSMPMEPRRPGGASRSCSASSRLTFLHGEDARDGPSKERRPSSAAVAASAPARRASASRDGAAGTLSHGPQPHQLSSPVSFPASAVDFRGAPGCGGQSPRRLRVSRCRRLSLASSRVMTPDCDSSPRARRWRFSPGSRSSLQSGYPAPGSPVQPHFAPRRALRRHIHSVAPAAYSRQATGDLAQSVFDCGPKILQPHADPAMAASAVPPFPQAFTPPPAQRSVADATGLLSPPSFSPTSRGWRGIADAAARTPRRSPLLSDRIHRSCPPDIAFAHEPASINSSPTF